ncbi:hypothetical protein [Undibacterium crateris]|uniref:hypothetical protein n=1 Tax=Undibacterium crateris TaxID=2528175 RepID=UPI001389E76F|nr:hypothetical protein [Undibacterium crateris]
MKILHQLETSACGGFFFYQSSQVALVIYIEYQEIAQTAKVLFCVEIKCGNETKFCQVAKFSLSQQIIFLAQKK